MQLPIPAAIFAALLLSILPGHAQQAEQAAGPNVTIRATIISLPNAEATLFSTQQDLSGKPAEALTALEKLVAQKQATSVANLALTTKSGQQSNVVSGKVNLAADPEISPDRKTVEINVLMNDDGHKITTAFQAGNGDAKFLGSVQKPTDTKMTDYVFVRVSY